MTAPDKTYDRRYFDTWYRKAGIGDAQRLARKVALAVAAAEYHLERPLRSVLDIGCGEGAWRAPLLKLRPKARYLGFDNSEYAIRRYGARRDLHFARFGDFAQLRPCAPVDLLICSDVLHYLPTRELTRGLPGLADLCAGVAFLEVFAKEDEGTLRRMPQKSPCSNRFRAGCRRPWIQYCCRLPVGIWTSC